MSKSGLAAVAAATDSVSKTQAEAAIAEAREEGRVAGLAEGDKAGREAGATAERARITGIQVIAMAGHEKLIAECIADGTCTPDMAAGRVLAAEKAIRDNQMKGIAGVETYTGKVAATVATPAAPTASVPQTDEGWKAEYAASPELQKQHESAASYANYMQGVADGRITRLVKK